MHWELKDVVTGLGRGDVSGIKVATDLIMAFCLNGGTIWTLVYVLVNVLDGLDRATDFQIDVTVKLHHQLPGMRYHMSIVKDILSLLNGPAILRASIVRIAILLDDGVREKWLGKALFADIVLNTSLRRTRTMKHGFGNGSMELGMDLGIWNLGRDDGINLFHSTNLVWLLQKNQEMHVRETTLLVFNGVNKASHLAIVTITNLLKQGLLFAMENPCDQIRPIHSSLTYAWWSDGGQT